jgi:histone acetyltransferase
MSTEGDRDANSKKRKAEELSPEGADDPDEDAKQEEDPPQHQDASKQDPANPVVDDNEAKVEAEEKKDVEDSEDPPSDEKKEQNGDKTEQNGDKMEVDEKKEESSNEKEEEKGEKKEKDYKKEEESKEKEDESGDANDENGDKRPAETPDKQETPTDDKTEEKVVHNPYDSLKWITITNDGKPSNLIKLVALKSLFAKQLPKMPRTYIARLVFDRRHTSLAIISDDPALKDTDEEVIGSICYRAFPEMRFAEIAFCAVNASHQVKVGICHVLCTSVGSLEDLFTVCCLQFLAGLWYQADESPKTRRGKNRN